MPAGIWIYYRAYAQNSFGFGYSLQDSFLTKPSNPIAQPVQDLNNRSFLANWSSVVGAETYELYVATDTGFTNLVSGFEPKTSIYDTEYLLDGMMPETTYYYKVVARNMA